VDVTSVVAISEAAILVADIVAGRGSLSRTAAFTAEALRATAR